MEWLRGEHAYVDPAEIITAIHEARRRRRRRDVIRTLAIVAAAFVALGAFAL